MINQKIIMTMKTNNIKTVILELEGTNPAFISPAQIICLCAYASGAYLGRLCENARDADLRRLCAKAGGADLRRLCANARYVDLCRLFENASDVDLCRLFANASDADLRRLCANGGTVYLGRLCAKARDADLVRLCENASGADLCRLKKVIEIKPMIKPYTRLLEALKGKGCRLEMKSPRKPWPDSTCPTTHCEGGWLVVLAEGGRELEQLFGTELAATIILRKSRPDAPLPNFNASNEAAMAFIKARAKEEAAM